MPRAPRHALVWSSEQQFYECSTQGQVVRRFQAGDDAAWMTRLDGITSLAFHGRSGSLNVYREQWPRGGGTDLPTTPIAPTSASAISG